MDERSSRWQQITPSAFAWERAALEYLRTRLPDEEPYRAWANFEFITNTGKIYEVDVAILTPRGFFLVEIKSNPGHLTGDAGTFRWEHQGRSTLKDNPLLLTNSKAKALKSLLLSSKAGRPLRRDFPLYVEPLIFLSAPGLTVDLDDRARTSLYGRGGGPGDQRHLPGVIDFLTAPNPRLARDPSRRITSEMARVLARAMEQLGIRKSRRSLRAGEYEMQRILDDGQGQGFQDFEAVHTQLHSVVKRVRVYANERGSSAEAKGIRQRAAEREFLVLQGLNHPGVLKVEQFTAHELGPALVFEHDPAAQRLDLWLKEHGDGLTIDARLDIVRQLADVLRYAHSRRVAHRALSPYSILVSGSPTNPHIKVFSWQTAGRVGTGGSGPGASQFGTSHLDALVDEAAAAYAAPEALSNPGADGIALDVFSLGAVAFLVLTGAPPAGNSVELLAAVREGNGLQLPAVLDGVGEGLRSLVAQATCPDLANRYDSVEWFSDDLEDAQRALLADEPATEAEHPEDARPGDRLGEFTVLRHLGKGSTAVALLVRDEDGHEMVLKVALDEHLDERIHDEAEALHDLHDRTIVKSYRKLTVRGRAALELSKAGDKTLARLLREEGSVGIDQLQRWGDDLLAAVEFLERVGRAHRDIKPDNLGIAPWGKNEELHLVLFDFSLSRAPVTDIRAGTPPYLEPFLVDRPTRRWDTAAERYAAAVTLYEMATGTTPVWGDGQSDPAALACEVTIAGDRLPSAAREALGVFFARALRRDPKERFDTAEDMRRAWERAFAEADQPAVTPTSGEPFDLAAAVAAADPTTALAALGFSQRTLDLLERLDVVTVADLVQTPAQTLRFASGFVPRLRANVLDVRMALRRRFPELAPKAGRRERKPATGDGGGNGLAESAADVQSLDLLVQQLVPRTTRSDSRAQEVVRLLLGLDPLPGQSAPPHWPSQVQVAAAIDLTPAWVSQLMSAQRQRWSRNPSLRRLRDEIPRLLDSMGGIVTFGELAEAVTTLRGTAEAVDDPLMLGRAGLRAACEVEGDGTEPRWAVRRKGDLVVLAARQALDGEPLDDTTGAARADYAVRLGAEADRIGAMDPLPSPAAVLTRLRAVEVRADIEPLADSRLVRLAAAMSANAAVSARLELYPRGLDARRALNLAQNALLVSGNAGERQERLSVRDVESRLRARYPEMATLPPRPQLDDLIEEVGLPLRWWPAEGDLPEGYGMVPLRQRGLTSVGRRAGDTVPRGRHEGAEVVEDVEERLAHALTAGGFLVLTVHPRGAEAAARALARFGVNRVSIEARLLTRLHEQAEAARVDWAKVIEADAAGPDGADWQRLLQLMGRAWPLVDQDVRAAGEAVLLTELGPLARYDAMEWVEAWRDATLAPRSGLRSVWLLLPAGSTAAHPTLDGAVVPLVSDGQVARLHRSWLEAAQ